MPLFPHTKLFNDLHRVIVLSGPHIQVLDTHERRLKSTTNLIRCSGISRDGRYLATTGDDKQLKIWDLDTCTLLSTRELPKKPTSIQFSRTTDILVSDKFGDVFRYAVYPNEQVHEKASCEVPASHESSSGGELVLGHASPLTSCLLSLDEKFIITADRDEHIRVSWYPEGHVIESCCLGHKKYVSAIHIPVASPTVLISGGGDPELKIWEWMTGRLQRNVAVFTAVEPFIRVTPPGGNPTSNVIFVVRKISSFLSDNECHVVFSVVGATAIFAFILAETSNQPDIWHYDFGRPVLEFTVCDQGTIWALLDVNFPQDSNDHPPKLVQAVQWSTDRFVNVGSSMVLDSLNTVCSLPATAEDLQALELYSDLSSLPKIVDRSQESPAPMEDEPTGDKIPISSGLTKRALGRLKHKRALDQLHREMGDSQDISVPDTKKIKAGSSSEESESMG